MAGTRSKTPFFHCLRRFAWVAALALAAGWQLPAGAAKDPPLPDLPRLARPTGRNGYEDFIAAAQLIINNPRFNEAWFPGSTLAQKRRALAERPVQRALDLLRHGLAKPVTPLLLDDGLSLRDAAEAVTVRTRMRRLGYLIEVEEVVLLADGRTASALADMRDGLHFEHVLRQAGSTQFELSITSSVTAPIATRREQLSAGDCERLMAVCREWLVAPDPVPAMLAANASIYRQIWDDPDHLPQLLPDDPDTSPDDLALTKDVEQLLGQSPGAVRGLATAAARAADSQMAQILGELQRPPWQRRHVTVRLGDPLATRLAFYFTKTLQSLTNINAPMETARIQLLACHAAVLRYRWEHDRLPASLEELHLGSLATDPFTGQPLIYRPLGWSYELSSAGWEDEPTGERHPVQLD